MCFRCFGFFRFQFCDDSLRVVPRIPAVFHLMNEGRTVFAQLLDWLPKYEFDKCVARYSGNFRVRKLPAYEQFLVLAFAQLTWRESLRDIETCLASFGPKLYHAGIRLPAARWPTPTKIATGASSLTSPTSSSSKPPRSTPRNRSALNSKPPPMRWTPPPLTCASRCFRGPRFGGTRPPSNSTRC